MLKVKTRKLQENVNGFYLNLPREVINHLGLSQGDIIKITCNQETGEIILKGIKL